MHVLADNSISNVNVNVNEYYSIKIWGAATEKDRLSSVVKDFYVGKFRIMLLFDLKQ